MARAEDAPFMDAHWSYISLTPRDWQARNPLSPSADLSGTDLAQPEPEPEPPITPPVLPPRPPITPPSPVPAQQGGTGSLDYGLLLLLVLASWGMRRRRNGLD